MPKFYKFAQLKAAHPTRLAAHKLPPEQHTWMGGIDHGKSHVCSPYTYTILDPGRPMTVGYMLSDTNSNR
jgi:hypothetical protein